MPAFAHQHKQAATAASYAASLRSRPIWNLKDIASKYCLNDCISLYQVIPRKAKFNNLYFTLKLM